MYNGLNWRLDEKVGGKGDIGKTQGIEIGFT